MRKHIPAIFVFVPVLVFVLASRGYASPGEVLFRNAVSLEKKVEYSRALVKYKEASTQLLKEGRSKLADECRYASTRIMAIRESYPYTEDQVRKKIKELYPKTDARRIDEVMRAGRLPSLVFDGRRNYFYGFTNTLNNLYADFRFGGEKGALGSTEAIVGSIKPYIDVKEDLPPGRSLARPITYVAEGEAVVPRGKLPSKGILKVWVPLPLVTAAQQDVEIISVYPDKYLSYPIRLDGDIALAYMEIPLEEIKGDLRIGAEFKFKHYEERFNIDPAKVGAYDKKSDLYRRYTASDRNIRVTPAIRARANKIAGTETNPYRIAKKFYDHVVHDLDYSYMPHGHLDVLNIPESVYVLENGIGDCGAQSIYFAALCRAAGIPARAPGGMQLFPVNEAGAGTHFWAQFYLPNYGWVPVDTSAGQAIKYLEDVPAGLKRDWIDYFFSKMDPFRYLIQVDVDVPLIPRPGEPLVFSMVLQMPTAVSRDMYDNPGALLMEAWKIKVRQIKNEFGGK
ncbi:MAG: transglutaminase-like domain-containing protein [Syntrophales bacterium]|nr:transglutaminase-like domain-containing protein [Syntrophales bacterium]